MQYHAHQFIAMLQGMFCHLCNTFKGSTSAQDMPSHHWTASPMSTQHHFPHYNIQHSLSSAALTIPAFSVPRARIPPQWPDHRMCMNSQFLIYLTGSPPEFHTHNSEKQVFKQNLPKMLLETKRLWNQNHSWEKFENCQNRQTESWFCIIKCFLSKKVRYFPLRVQNVVLAQSDEGRNRGGHSRTTSSAFLPRKFYCTAPVLSFEISFYNL